MWAYLDREPAAIDAHEIHHHLLECAPCEQESRIEARLKELIALAHQASKPAPDQVRRRVTASITRIEVQITRVQHPLD